MKKYLIVILLVFLSLYANAADNGVVTITNTVTEAIKAAGGSIFPMALKWLGSFMLVQFIMTNFGVLKSGGDIDALWAKLLGSLLWFSFCIYVLNSGPDFIDSIGNSILSSFTSWPSPEKIISIALGMSTPFLIGATVAGLPIVGAPAISSFLFSVVTLIMGVGIYMAIKIIMLSLELGLIVMLAPLSFSLLGLDAFKDQGIAPFKSLIALVFRIIFLSVIFAAYAKLGDIVVNNMKSIADLPGPVPGILAGMGWKNPDNWAQAFNIVLSSVTAFPLLAFLIYKSDSLASSLAGGSANLGSAGAAAASGGAAGGAAGAAGKVPEAMSSFMAKLGGGGSLPNAGGGGTGGGPLKPPHD